MHTQPNHQLNSRMSYYAGYSSRPETDSAIARIRQRVAASKSMKEGNTSTSDQRQIRKPQTHDREYRHFTLDNGVRVIVGSDPACDKSGAAATVDVGITAAHTSAPALSSCCRFRP